jgi:hypothetical protein
MAAGIALWFTRSSIDLIGTPEGPVRVAMLSSLPELAGLILLGAAVCLVAHRRVPAEAFWPLFPLLLLGVPYLPWLPDAVPALLLLAGPARWAFWGIAIAQCFWAARQTDEGRRASESRTAAAWAGLGVLAAGAIGYGIAAARITGTPVAPGGDEPHYLVIAQSLIRDRDLAIENNHQRGDYREYFGGHLRPDYLTRGVDREIYSIHPVGLPVVIAPFYRAAGYPGVVALLVLITAIAAALFWRTARTVTGSGAAATFGWAAAALSLTAVFTSFSVYPEALAALVVALCFTWPEERRQRFGSIARFIGQTIGVAALPWLHAKYAPMSLALLCILVRRVWRDPTDAAARRLHAATAAALWVVSVGAWLCFFWWIWGDFSPMAPYGAARNTRLRFMWTGLPALIVDQEYGVLTYAPALLLAVPGLWGMWRAAGEARRRAVEIAIVVALLVLTVSAHRMWWGGVWPGRQLAAVLFSLSVPIAWAYRAAIGSATRRAAYWLLLLVGLSTTAIVVTVRSGYLVVNGRDGSAALVEWAWPASATWALLPSYLYHGPLVATAFAVLWIAAGTLMIIVLGRLRLDAGRAAAAAALGSAAVVVALALLVPIVFRGRTQPDVLLEGRGRTAGLDRFDARARPFALVFDPLRRVHPNVLPPLFRLTASESVPRPRPPIPLSFNGRFSIPAGEYEVELQAKTGGAVEGGSLALQIGRIGRPLVRWPVTLDPDGFWRQRFTLPIDIASVGFVASEELEPALVEIRLQPMRVEDERRRVTTAQVLAASQYGPVVVYFHDEETWPEPTGFWTRGGATAAVTLATIAGQGATLRVHSGQRPNTVTLATPGWQERINLVPGRTRDIHVPAGGGRFAGLVQLSIASTSGFVPAKAGGLRTDVRLLGCWVEVVRGAGTAPHGDD